MAGTPGQWLHDARGVAALAVAGVVGVTDIVERLHATIGSFARPLGVVHDAPARGIAGLVYRRVRAVARGVGSTLDAALAPFAASAPHDSLQRDHWLAAVNGVLGDRLAATNNPLAIAMHLRHPGAGGNPGAVHDKPSYAGPMGGRVAIFLHGLCMHDGHWPRGAGSADAAVRDAGYTPVYLRYNTGRAIHANGAELSALLDTVDASELALVGHSMGGLVARAACEHAQRHGAAWLSKARNLVTIGTPHRGCPLERVGQRLDRWLKISPYSAPFAAIGGTRSEGIRDLGDGAARADSALPAYLQRHAIAGSFRFGSDGLVAIDSALARGDSGFDPADTIVIDGTGHLELMRHPKTIAALARWLAAPRASGAAAA